MRIIELVKDDYQAMWKTLPQWRKDQLRAVYSDLSVKDIEELEKTTNREKEMYTQKDIDSRDEEIANLKAEIERKDEALKYLRADILGCGLRGPNGDCLGEEVVPIRMIDAALSEAG